MPNDNAQSLADRLPKLPGASPKPIVGKIGVGNLGASMPSIGPRKAADSIAARQEAST